MKEWISVEDRLPKINKDVLFYNGKNIEVRHLKKIRWTNGLRESGFNLCWYPGGRDNQKSFFWMPLPEPPK